MVVGVPSDRGKNKPNPGMAPMGVQGEYWNQSVLGWQESLQEWSVSFLERLILCSHSLKQSGAASVLPGPQRAFPVHPI